MKYAFLFALIAAHVAFAVSRPVAWPLFSLDIGAAYNSYHASHKAVYGYYHDLDKDKMVHDADLLCNMKNFSGVDFNVSGKLGVTFVGRFALFADIGYNRVNGEYRFKDYSRDKDWTDVDASLNSYMFGAGVQFFLTDLPVNALNETFIGISYGWLLVNEENDLEQERDFDYGMARPYIKMELGKLWEIREHLFVGFTIKDAIEFGSSKGREFGNYIGLALTIQTH